MLLVLAAGHFVAMTQPGALLAVEAQAAPVMLLSLGADSHGATARKLNPANPFLFL